MLWLAASDRGFSKPPLRSELTGPVHREIQDLTPLPADRTVSPNWHEVQA